MSGLSSSSDTVVLFFADVFGKPGRRAIAAALPDLISEYQPDFLLANAENLAGGRGINRKTFNEMLSLGFHGFTSGNHVWDNKEVLPILDSDPRLLRPANFPNTVSDPCPGKGFHLFENNGKSLFVINVMGRVFMDPLEDPFRTVDGILKEHGMKHPTLVDIHADATSEKYAMGWFLDGRVSAVVGSHSHVQTADERVLPKGTAYITDVGMTGAFDSVIGLQPAEIIRKFMTKRPQRVQSATQNPGISCVVITIGPDKKAKSIVRIRKSVALGGLDQEKDLE